MKKLVMALVCMVGVASADQISTLSISGMTCPACVKNVKGTLNEVQGVKESTVYLKEGRAEVKASEGTSAEAMCDAVKKAGYGCKVSK